MGEFLGRRRRGLRGLDKDLRFGILGVVGNAGVVVSYYFWTFLRFLGSFWGLGDTQFRLLAVRGFDTLLSCWLRSFNTFLVAFFSKC